MLVIKEKELLLNFPVFQQCYRGNCDTYRLILHNDYTKEVYMIRVVDWTSECKLRMTFRIVIPECMSEGTYTYYLIKDEEWYPDDIDTNIPKKSKIWTDKEAVNLGGIFIIFEDKLLVTSKFKARLLNNDVTEPFYVWQDSEDDRVIGEIVKEINIIQTGLFKYFKEDKLCCEPTQFIDNKKDEYIYFKE